MLPANAQTWVNLHLLFTHGNGVVMSPGHREIRGRFAVPLSAGYSACRQLAARPFSEPRLYFGEGATATSS